MAGLGFGYFWLSATATATWIAGSWSNRIEITIPSGTVGENLSDFPVYVNLSHLGSDFFSSVKSDGSDIRITTSDGETEVPFELVSIDTGAETGELYFKGTLSSSSDTSFYIYYGNASATAYAATDTYGRNNVWDSGFVGVYHLEEDPGGSAPQFADSSGSGHDATANNLTSGSSTAGKIGSAVTISDNQSIQFGDLGLSDTVSLTAFIDGSSAETFTEYFYWDSANHFQVKTFVNIFFGGATGGNDTSTNGSGKYLGQYAVTAASDGTTNRYKDGALLSAYPISLSTPTLTGQSLQIPLPSTTTINGYVDEVRISGAVRSGAWIAAEYLNINAPASFYAIGEEEDKPEELMAPTVTTEAVTDIATTSATGNGTVTSDGGGTITERGIVWSTSSNPTTSDNKATSAGTTGSFTTSLTGLSPGTLYYVRAYATNSVGTSYGDGVTFTTQEETEDPPEGMEGEVQIRGTARFRGGVQIDL